MKWEKVTYSRGRSGWRPDLPGSCQRCFLCLRTGLACGESKDGNGGRNDLWKTVALSRFLGRQFVSVLSFCTFSLLLPRGSVLCNVEVLSHKD